MALGMGMEISCNSNYLLTESDIARQGCAFPHSSLCRFFLTPVPTSLLRLAGVLVLLQITDAYLTWLGVQRFGVEAEGNLLLRQAMSALGVAPSLIAAKALAVIAIALILRYGSGLRWVSHAFTGLNVLYLCVAVLPWTYLLCQ